MFRYDEVFNWDICEKGLPEERKHAAAIVAQMLDYYIKGQKHAAYGSHHSDLDIIEAHAAFLRGLTSEWLPSKAGDEPAEPEPPGEQPEKRNVRVLRPKGA
jgi:hypothetical protein